MTGGEGSDPRRAVVTGASRGLGAVVSRLLASEGFELLVTARDATPLERYADELRSDGGRVTALAGAVEDPGHRAHVAGWARQGPGLHLLVNNASELGVSPLPPLADYPLDALRRVLEVNLVAPLALTQALLGPLERGRGLVVNISSDAALGAYPGWGAYGASKAGLDLVSRTLAAELAPRGISVVSVDPGDMRTDMHQAAYPGVDIRDRPPPEVTLPFWVWLMGQEPTRLTGRRYQAQGERWEVTA